MPKIPRETLERAKRRQWIDASTLRDLFAPPSGQSLADDVAGFEARLRDPWGADLVDVRLPPA